MSLTEKQFDVLCAMATDDSLTSQRRIAEKTHYSLGTINRICHELADRGYIADSRITRDGVDALQPYRVKRAVFLAAGFGSRMVPVTLNTPKPLVRIHGKRLIDGLLDACVQAGIEEICLVRGYLSEQFDQLTAKYPMITFVDNPFYNEANNISSALLVKDQLRNAYVMEADLLLHNPAIISKYHYRSNFLAIRKDRTDDWCFDVKDGVITKEKIGGIHTWQMVGISYWNDEDGEKLSQDLQKAYEQPGGKEFYWEQVPLKVFKDHYKVAVRECRDEDIVEIDTFSELKEIDKSYDI